VRLCSVHKAKGLEAPNVFVLNEAKICKDPRNSWEQNEQEKNLSYISITRGMDNLYLVREKDE
jgi:superfamily I DNA/RNA helicase